ncbi:hypothetical protein K502DRAFT_337091 [Neoconidiobolus thromboides FSU 785]|nr:hypothetical protein K502DRAFT_337091 [Neoconidiobolus thromboides FSU 785]
MATSIPRINLKGNGEHLDSYLQRYSTDTYEVESSNINLTSSLLTHPPHLHEFRGLVYMLLSAFGFSLNGLLVKVSGAYFSAAQIVLARSIIQGLGGIILCYSIGIQPFSQPRYRLLLLLRGFFGAIGLALYYYSLTVLPIADATVIFFTSPAFTGLLAHLTLNEDYSWFDGLASFFCLIGVVLTSKPNFLFGKEEIPIINLLNHLPTPAEQSIGVLAAFIGALFAACAYVTVRKIGRSVHFLSHVVYFGLASTIFSGVMVLTDHQKSKLPSTSLGLNWPTLCLLLVGLTAILGQCLLNKGLQLCRAGPATLMRNVDVVLAYFYGIFLFHEIPNIYSISGSTIIVVCTVAMGLRKWFN